MTDTTCPNCDAPAPVQARSCARCGYRFLEDSGSVRRPRPGRRTVVFGAAALVVVGGATVLAVAGASGGNEDAAAGNAPPAHLEVLSEHPLATRAAERLLEERFITIRDDDTAAVRCSERVPKPAHSVRRCIVRYPGGIERRVVLLTNASGAEVLSKP
jgi:ribosomal protein L40E